MAGQQNALVPYDVLHTNGTQQPSLILGSRGDTATLAHIAGAVSGNGWPYIAMSRIGQLPSFDLPPSGATNIAVDLQPLAQGNTVAFDYRGVSFVDALRQDGNPNSMFVC